MVNVQNILTLQASLYKDEAVKRKVGFNMAYWIATGSGAQDKLDGCKTTACLAGTAYILKHPEVFDNITEDTEICCERGIRADIQHDRAGTIRIDANKLREEATAWLDIHPTIASALFGGDIFSIKELPIAAALAALDLILDWANGDYYTDSSIQALANKIDWMYKGVIATQQAEKKWKEGNYRLVSAVSELD